MDVFSLGSDTQHYTCLVVTQDSDADVLVDQFDGSPMAESWQPLPVRAFRGDRRNRNLPLGDFPLFQSSVPVFGTRAVAALRDLLEPCGELLPLACDEGEYFAYNVTRIADALDLKRTRFQVFESGGIMSIDCPVFRSEALASLTIFRIPQAPAWDVYVTTPFRERVLESGLRGYEFQRHPTDAELAGSG